MSQIKKVVVHCSDSPDTLDIGAAEIKQWHTMPPPKGRGWADIGYHEVIRRSGHVEAGRFENGDSILEGKEIGAHVAGQNSDSIAICIVGRDHFAAEQMEALYERLLYRLKAHGLGVSQVYGHYELDPKKTCPNLNMGRVRLALVERLGTSSFTI